MSTDESTPAAVAAADEAYEAMKTLASVTGWAAQPGPDVYSVLGNLKLVAGTMLADTLRNLGTGLGQTLTDETYDVHQDDAGDPGIAAMNTADYLNQAAEKANEIGQLLSAAQVAITRQGYNRPPPQHGDRVCLVRPDGSAVTGTWQHPAGADPHLVDDDGAEHTEYTTSSGAGRRSILARAGEGLEEGDGW